MSNVIIHSNLPKPLNSIYRKAIFIYVNILFFFHGKFPCTLAVESTAHDQYSRSQKSVCKHIKKDRIVSDKVFSIRLTGEIPKNLRSPSTPRLPYSLLLFCLHDQLHNLQENGEIPDKIASALKSHIRT